MKYNDGNNSDQKPITVFQNLPQNYKKKLHFNIFRIKFKR